ncbi:MAG: Ig-like domain-containing protein [Gemmatimonadota bacterium]|nr:Ig-like domain-containing protein [Gemmatimonadota bacterium]
MRRLAAPLARPAVAAVAGVAIACASMAAPPGGPEDHAPAEIVLVVPESGTLNFNKRVVEFRFNEVISDRGTGPADLGQLVLISPRDGAPRVAYRRDAIGVRPRSGWRPNTTYSVTLLPGVTDLRGNRSTEARTTVFSTGGAIAPFALRGRVFDWMAERPAPRARVEAISRDSVVYVTIADSTGGFTAGPLPAGEYTLKAFIDQNNNRALDRGEAWDSVPARTSRAGVETAIELLAVPRDTIPPRIIGVSPTDSVTLSVDFDRPLDTRQTITPALFAVARADSTPIPVREAVSRRDFERREEARRAREDSARADTARAARPMPDQPQLVRGPEAPARPSVPPPVQQVVLRLGAPLIPGASYRVTASGVRNLLGRPGTSSRVVQVPRPAPAPRDTTRRVPP